jgi:hypothetical protein
MPLQLEGVEAQIWASAYGAAYVMRIAQGLPGHVASTDAIEIANTAVAHYSAIAEAVSSFEPNTPPPKRRRKWLAWRR